jgi:type IV pilus assembly protein PilC
MFAEFGAKDALPELTKLVIAASKGFVTALPFAHPSGVIGACRRDVFLPHAAGEEARPHGDPQAADPRPRAPEDRRRALHAHARHLLASGVPILDALDIVAKTAGNVVIEEGLATPARASPRARTWPSRSAR